MSASVSRAFAVIEALAGRSLHGMRLSELAAMLRQSPSTTLRDLQGLEALGYASRIPGRDERWHLTPRLIQIAIAHQQEVAREEQQLDNFRQRYSRVPV